MRMVVLQRHIIILGTSYNQRVDDFTFVTYDQATPNVYYFPDDFQNGDFTRNAQIRQSPHTYIE